MLYYWHAYLWLPHHCFRCVIICWCKLCPGLKWSSLLTPSSHKVNLCKCGGEKSWMIVELMLPQRESSYHLRCIQIPVVTPSEDQRSGMMRRLSGPLSSLFSWRRERLKMVRGGRGWRQHHGACRLPGRGLCFKWFTSKVKNVSRWNVHTFHQLVAL